eukprot:1161437-Pelagomonas_calceolata.AAC.3
MAYKWTAVDGCGWPESGWPAECRPTGLACRDAQGLRDTQGSDKMEGTGLCDAQGSKVLLHSNTQGSEMHRARTIRRAQGSGTNGGHRDLALMEDTGLCHSMLGCSSQRLSMSEFMEGTGLWQ